MPIDNDTPSPTHKPEPCHNDGLARDSQTYSEKTSSQQTNTSPASNTWSCPTVPNLSNPHQKIPADSTKTESPQPSSDSANRMRALEVSRASHGPSPAEIATRVLLKRSIVTRSTASRGPHGKMTQAPLKVPKGFPTKKKTLKPPNDLADNTVQRSYLPERTSCNSAQRRSRDNSWPVLAQTSAFKGAP